MDDRLIDSGPSERGWHGFDSASRCLRLWALENIKGERFPYTDALVKGSLLHVGLAHHYALKLNPEANVYSPAAAISSLAQNKSKEKGISQKEASLWPKFVEPIQEAVEAYTQNYIACRWEVLEVERELRARIPRLNSTDPSDTFLFTQRADLVIADSNGGIWIVDHKSCYRIISKTLRQHILSGQFLGYQVLGRQKYGKNFKGVLINRIKLRPPYEFHRCPLEPAPAALSCFVQKLKQTQAHMDTWAHLKDPMDYPPAFSDHICFGKYGACPAFELCQWGEN